MARDPLDRFYTPPWATEALLRRLRLERGARVLEPCAGAGGIARVLRATGMHVTTIDVDPGVYTDVTGDFLAIERFGRERLERLGPWDWVITNPPYTCRHGKAADFIEAFLRVAPRVACLLRSAWVEVCEDRERLMVERTRTHQLDLARVQYHGPGVEGASCAPGPSSWMIWWPDAPRRLPRISAVPRSESVETSIVRQQELFS